MVDDIVQIHFYNQPCSVTIGRESGVAVTLECDDTRAWTQYRDLGADSAVTTGSSVCTSAQSIYTTHCGVSSTADQLVLKAGKAFMATAIPYTPPLLLHEVGEVFTTHCTEAREFSPEWVASSKPVAFHIVNKLAGLFGGLQLVHADTLGLALVMTFSHDIIMWMTRDCRVNLSVDRNDIQVPYDDIESMLFPVLDMWYQNKEEEIQV